MLLSEKQQNKHRQLNSKRKKALTHKGKHMLQSKKSKHAFEIFQVQSKLYFKGSYNDFKTCKGFQTTPYDTLEIHMQES